MASKVISKETKAKAVKRISEGKSDAANEGRRIGVSAQAVRAWVRASKKDEPENKAAARKAKAAAKDPDQQPVTTSPPPPAGPAVAPPEVIPPDTQPSGGGAGASAESETPPPPATPADEVQDVEAALAAEEVEGAEVSEVEKETPPSEGGDKPESEEEEDPDFDDRAMVEMVGGLAMGLSTRGGLLFAGWKYKVDLDWDDKRLEDLYVLRPKEIAALKPCFKFLGPKIRELAGSSQTAGLAFAAGIIAQGAFDRFHAIGRVVRDAVKKAKAETAGKPAA